MKKVLFFLVGLLLVSSCQDEVIQGDTEKSQSSTQRDVQKGMQRVVLNSRSEIKPLIDQLGDPTGPNSRSVISADVLMSENEEIFVSLLEANRQKIMSSLTAEQLAEIENDPEGLEFDPTDSIIADINFAQLLNAHRQIQIGDTVFQYVENGVGYINSDEAYKLDSLDNMTVDLNPDIQTEGGTIQFGNGVTFKPFNLKRNLDDDTNVMISTIGQGFIPSEEDEDLSLLLTDQGMKLSNGITIPNENIRVIEYTGSGKGKGDGNWFHKFRTGLVGENVVAIKKFSDRKKLTMSFYDQNYLIYSYIGTKLKMQKQKIGIWWNIKADAMIQGWDLVSVKYTYPGQVIETFGRQFDNGIELPASTVAPAKIMNEDCRLFSIPFKKVGLPFKTVDVKLSAVGKTMEMLIKKMIERASAEDKAKINNDLRRAGLMSFEDKNLYVFYGPRSRYARDVNNIETKFYSEWFPGEWEFSYTYGESVDVKKIVKSIVKNISLNDGVELHSGIVYGAINYHGTWLGAVIRKNSDIE